MLVFVFSEQNKRIPRVQTADLQNLQSLLFAKFAHKTAFCAVQLAVPDIRTFKFFGSILESNP